MEKDNEKCETEEVMQRATEELEEKYEEDV